MPSKTEHCYTIGPTIRPSREPLSPRLNGGPMFYETIERGPHGDKLWRITECKACDGRGTVWYPGCGAAAADCGQCDGMGETARFKRLDLNGKPFGPWRTSD